MGSGQQNFDIQKLFKTSPAPSSSSSSTPPPPPASYNPYPHSPNPFPPQPTYPPPSSNFPSGMYPYLHYPQDPPRPGPYSPANFPQPPYQPPVASIPQPSVSSPPLDGARLMALLQSTGDLRESTPLLSSLELPPPAVASSSPGSGTIEASEPPPAISPALPTAPPVPQSGLKTPGKLAKGRGLSGERVVYDAGLTRGEDQPQLEVSTITVYSSDPVPLLGRQIAVNKNYICYGLRPGSIRVLNINTASRSLCKGHTQRVVDMAFVSSDVHILASSSTEGRVYVRKILEGDQITEQIIVGLQFTGDWIVVEPRVCWHSRPDILIVGIGKYVFTVDTRRVRSEEPLECSVKNPVDGVTIIGSHEDDVTGLAVCPGTNRFASSSKDGTVRLWAETELAVLAPHGMDPVYSVNFIPAPRQDHVVMVTGGPLNKELKLFSPAGADGLNWMCIQTLGLTNSGETKPEEEFFNQLLPVPNASLIILSNAKRSLIYVVHLEFGQLASSTRMNFISEFSVKPILSFTATSDNLVDGEGIIQLYCIQPQAIQQHSLDTSMCLPPPQEAESFTSGITPPPSKLDNEKPKGFVDSFPAPEKESEREKLLLDPDEIDKAILPDEVLEGTEPGKPGELKPELSEEKEKKPHLITPSDLMSMVARSKSEVLPAAGGVDEVEAKDVLSLDRDAGELNLDGFEDRSRGLIDNCDAILDILESGDPDEADALIDSYGSHAFPEPELEDSRGPDDISVSELKEVPVKGSDASASSVSQSPAVSKGRKNKNKASASVPGSSVVASSSVGPPEAETNGAAGVGSEGLAAQVQTMQESLNQLVILHKDMQKQFSMATAPMAKRMETSLGQRLEKIIKANVDAMLAKLQEENAKREKAERERSQQLLAAVAASTKDLPAAVERIVKKELGALGPSVAKLLSPAIEKAVSGGLADSQALSEKAVPQLEKAVTSKLETLVARHLQSQFQTTGRQALQEAMRTCFEGSVVPSFERSCKTMFEQVDSAFQKGMAEHISHAQQQSSAAQNALASSFQDSVNTLAHSLKAEIAEGQRKLETRLKPGNAPEKVLAMSLQHVEAAMDPTIELSRLVSQGKLEEAFNKALSLSDVSIVSWLCNQVDPVQVFSGTPIPLSQGVLLSLIQQLGYDLATDTARKLPWIQGAALNLNPNDPMLSGHMKVFLEQLYQNLHRQLMITSGPSELTSNMKLVCHLVNSLLTSCK